MVLLVVWLLVFVTLCASDPSLLLYLMILINKEFVRRR